MTIEQAYIALGRLDSTPPGDLDGGDLANALLLVAADYRDRRTAVSTTGIDGAPDWYGYESALWKLSERLRPIIAARKDWRSGSAVLAAIEALCANQKYGKGRQNLVLMLGTFGGDGDGVGPLLADPDVDGPAIKALTKLRDYRYQDTVAGMLPELRGWKRSAAKKYVEVR